METISNLLSSIAGGALWIIFSMVIIISYLILALFNWSFIKPIKYIGISIIVVGSLLILVRALNSVLLGLVSTIFNLPASIMSILLRPVLIMGIVYIIIGILLIILNNLYYKNKKS